jgi:diguanylate cyclase (GGDEF)-like protein/PAS domain S-box-containing protein
MDRPVLGLRLATIARWTVLTVLAFAALNWLGWAIRSDLLTRFVPSWPPMTPWTALWTVALGVAIRMQSGRSSSWQIWVARGLSLAIGAFALATLAEYGTGVSFGIDELLFGDSVRTLQASWPGRPSPQTAISVLLLAGAVTLLRVDRWVRVAWPVCIVGCAVIPVVTVAAYLFDAMSLVTVAASTGQAMTTALALILLHVAASVTRPDRLPIAWLLERPDLQALVRLGGVLAGFPIVVAMSRLAVLRAGLDEPSSWTVAVAVGTVVIGVGTFYLSQREQKLLIEKEVASRQQAEAESRYRILAENAVDVVMHLHGWKVTWISPSVEAAFGGTPEERWIGSDFSLCVHPNDLDALTLAKGNASDGETVLHRFRLRSIDGGYHWVDGHGKPYLDAEGNVDGLIAALRIVDDQVEAEQRLEQLARFDTLTGLANRAEAIMRLEYALALPPVAGTHLGVLFCDVDHFKAINDTWGHGVGDTVLATLAARICECVRRDDTVGRTGGDEILVLLPGVQSIEEAALIAEKIRSRVAEPIREAGHTMHVTLSIGATIALSGEPVAAITARADAAMYQAKMHNRNTVIRIEATE